MVISNHGSREQVTGEEVGLGEFTEVFPATSEQRQGGCLESSRASRPLGRNRVEGGDSSLGRMERTRSQKKVLLGCIPDWGGGAAVFKGKDYFEKEA